MTDVTLIRQDSGGGNVSTITDVTWGTAGQAPANGDYAQLEWTYLATNPRTDPTGWTLVSDITQGNDRATLWERFMDGTESGAVAGWSNTGVNATNRQTAVLNHFRNCLGRDGAVTIIQGTSSGTTRPNPTKTSTVAGCAFVCYYSERASSGTTSITAPAGMTNNINSGAAGSGSGGSFTASAVDLTTKPAAGVYSPAAWTAATSGTFPNTTTTVALKPTVSALPIPEVVETDVVQPLAKTKTLAAGLPIETSVALGLAGSKATVLGQPVEHNTPLALASAKSGPLGDVLEVGGPLGLAPAKALPLGLIVERTLAQPPAPGKTLPLELLGEQVVALGLTPSKATALGLAAETDQLFSLSKSKTGAFPLITDQSAILVLSATKSGPLALVAEVESALPFTIGFSLMLGQVGERTAPFPLGATKSLPLGLITDRATPQALGKTKATAFASVASGAVALGLSPSKSTSLGLVEEIETLFALAASVMMELGLVSESGQALPLGAAPPTGYLTMVVYRHGVAVSVVSRGVWRNGHLVAISDEEIV